MYYKNSSKYHGFDYSNIPGGAGLEETVVVNSASNNNDIQSTRQLLHSSYQMM